MRKKVFLFIFCLFFVYLDAKNVQFVGNVVSDGEKMIGSKYMGYVSKVHVDIGDRVKREDYIFEIESAEFDFAKVQSELMVDQSKLVIEHWRSRISRLDKKRKRVQANKFKDFQFELGDIDSQIDNAQIMLEAAKIAMKNAIEKTKEIMYVFSHLKMKAPSNGIIVKKNIKVGDMVMPGMLAIKLVDTDDLYVDIPVSEYLIKYFYVDKKAKIKFPSLDKTFTGEVKSITPTSNILTHKITVRLSINKKDPRILPGMYSEVFIDIPNETNKKVVKK